MEKKNTLLLTVIAVATLLVAVIGATFAYFASTVDTENATVDFSANTAPMNSAFIATGTSFNLEVTADTMQKFNAAEGKLAAEVAEEERGKLEVKYGSSQDDVAMYCTYNVYWQWTADEDAGKYAYTAHSPIEKGSDTLYASAEDVVGYNDPREFTIQAIFESNPAVPEQPAEGEPVDGNELTLNTIAEETDFTELEYVKVNPEDENSAERSLIATAKIWSNQAGEGTETVHTWEFIARFYNIPAYQNDLAGKTFSGIFTVDDVQC